MQIFVETTRYHDCGYDFTKLEIRTGRAETLDNLIEQCIDNKVGYYDGDGYTGADTAARMKRRYEWIREQGYSSLYVSHSRGSESIIATWQHYTDRAHGRPDGYCEGSFRLPERLAGIRASSKLLTQLVDGAKRRKVNPYDFIHDPKYMIDALQRRNAIAIETVKLPVAVDGNYWNEELCVRASSTTVKLRAAS
jgi:hypothetical protein